MSLLGIAASLRVYRMIVCSRLLGSAMLLQLSRPIWLLASLVLLAMIASMSPADLIVIMMMTVTIMMTTLRIGGVVLKSVNADALKYQYPSAHPNYSTLNPKPSKFHGKWVLKKTSKFKSKQLPRCSEAPLFSSSCSLNCRGILNVS